MDTWLSSEAAEAWRRARESRDRTMQPTTDVLFAEARLRPGIRVLEVAAGTGEVSVQAALLVGAQGSVVATDISEQMLDGLLDQVVGLGLANTSTQVADGAALNFPEMSFDAIICRNGLMFIEDLPKALAGMVALLAPGGRIAASVWTAGSRNVRMVVPLAVVREFGATFARPPALELALALGSPTLLRDLFVGAGLEDVSVTAVPADRQHSTAVAAVEDLTANHMPSRELFQALEPTRRAAAVEEIENRFRAYEGPGGCVLPGEQLVVAGSRSAAVNA